MANKRRMEQKYIVLLNDGTVVGTQSCGPFTEDASWLCERWYQEYFPEMGAKAMRIAPRQNSKEEEANG